MISFRFHLVSIVAVFLALGLGVLVGTTVINRGIVAGLQAQTTRLEQNARDLQDRVNQLQPFVEQVAPYLIEDELLGEQAVVITQEGTSEAAIGNVEEGLRRAGASVVALLSVGPRMALPEESDRKALAEAIGTTGISAPEALEAEAAAVVADRLAFGPRGHDVLIDLIDGDFLLNLGPELGEQGLRDLSQADLVIAVGGGIDPPAVSPDRFLVPMVRGLAAAGSGPAVAAAEGRDSDYEFVTVLREDAETAAVISTQDNVDELPGMIGFVLTLDDLLLGRPGHYGVKDGNSGVVPPPQAG